MSSWICYAVCFFVMWSESFFYFASVYHSKQAPEISPWKPVYGLPPHMFAVFLCRGQPGNERLLRRRETQAFLSSSSSIRYPRLSLSSPPFSLSISHSVCLLFSNDRSGKLEWCFSVWPSWAIRPPPTEVQLASALEYFRCLLVANICTTTNPLSHFLLVFMSIKICPVYYSLLLLEIK